MENKNIILCGVGGQGTILASKLIAAAAMQKGLEVKTAETIGMAQRGGSVFSHLRIGRDLNAPMIAKGQADIILGFEPAEAVRHLPFLKENGTVVVSSHPILPVSAMIGNSTYHLEEVLEYLKAHVKNLVLFDGAGAMEEIGSSKVLNVLLLGAALRTNALGLTQEDILQAIHAKVPQKFHALNEKALNYTSEKRQSL